MIFLNLLRNKMRETIGIKSKDIKKIIKEGKEIRKTKFLSRIRKERQNLYNINRFPKNDIIPEEQRMEVQDMTQINRLYQIRQKQRQAYEKRIRNVYYQTGIFLHFMKNSLGKLNSLIKFVFNIGNRTNIKKLSLTNEEYATKCHLLSQCYTTTQTINYFFCNPNINFISINEIFPLITENNIINIEISIGGTNYRNGDIKFPGHIFNIIILPGQNIFWIQSYIYNYTIQFKQISMEECNQIILLYRSLFVNPIYKNFNESENPIWFDLTNANLVDYNNRSIIGTRKPINYSQKFCFFNTLNMNEYLLQKYNNILQIAIDKIRYADPYLITNDIKLSFGNEQTIDSIYSLLVQSKNKIR